MARTAWLVTGSILAAAALVSGTYNVIGLLAHEMETRVETVPAEGIRRIEVDDDAGSVTIEAADVDEITVRARIGHGLRRSGSSVRVDGETLLVRGSCPVFGSEWCDVRYTIEVPREIDVVVDSDNDGVTIVGVHGHVEAHSDNGSIRLEDVVGDAVLTSDNGGIHAFGLTAERVSASSDNGGIELELVQPPMSVDATSDNGDVVLVVPSGDEVYAVTVDTDNGNADNQLRTDPASDRHIDVTTDNGDATVRYAG
jgi:hypothetical protein